MGVVGLSISRQPTYFGYSQPMKSVAPAAQAALAFAWWGIFAIEESDRVLSGRSGWRAASGP
jgi:hypothetical protein